MSAYPDPRPPILPVREYAPIAAAINPEHRASTVEQTLTYHSIDNSAAYLSPGFITDHPAGRVPAVLNGVLFRGHALHVGWIDVPLPHTVNGGDHGSAERWAAYQRALGVLQPAED